MSDRYRQVRRALCAVYQDVFDYAYEHYSLPVEWESAEVLITSKLPRSAMLRSGRPTIITDCAPEIAWLLGRLGEAFSSVNSGTSGTEFYGRLARVIRKHEMAGRPCRVNSILNAVMEEAFTMLDEMEQQEHHLSRPTAKSPLSAA